MSTFRNFIVSEFHDKTIRQYLDLEFQASLTCVMVSDNLSLVFSVFLSGHKISVVIGIAYYAGFELMEIAK